MLSTSPSDILVQPQMNAGLVEPVNVLLFPDRLVKPLAMLYLLPLYTLRVLLLVDVVEINPTVHDVVSDVQSSKTALANVDALRRFQMSHPFRQ